MADHSFLNAVMQNSTFGYTYNKIMLDENGHPVDYIFLDVNASYEKMIGVPRDRIVGKKVSEVLPDLDKDAFCWIENFGNVALTGEKSEFEAYSKAVDRWFHLSIISPEYLYFVGISFDITDKKKTELQLAQSEELNRRYVENAPDGIFIANAEGRYLKANIAACRMLGYGESEIRGRHVSDFVTDDTRQISVESFRLLTQNGHISTIRKMKRKDGTPITVVLDAVALQDSQFIAFCKDITSSIQLMNEKEQYFNVFSSITQPILITDPEGKITAVNDAFTEMYGYSREEILHRTPDMLNPDMLNPDPEKAGAETEYEFMNKGIFETMWACVSDPARRKWEGVIINRRKDGSAIWVDLLANGAFDANGKLTSILCYPIDVTQRRELENKNRIKLYQTIADLAELRDDETGYHMKRVGIFAKLLAKESGMPPQFCANIEIFAPMHDIGKVGILDSILRAPRKLTKEEFEVMKSHTILGHNIVKGKSELEMAADITLNHHERFDGTGYPGGIAGDTIPLSAQITAICDVYDALRSTRPYKAAWSHDETVSCIENSAGSQFSPDLVDRFLKIRNDFADIFRTFMDPPVL